MPLTQLPNRSDLPESQTRLVPALGKVADITPGLLKEADLRHTIPMIGPLPGLRQGAVLAR